MDNMNETGLNTNQNKIKKKYLPTLSFIWKGSSMESYKKIQLASYQFELSSFIFLAFLLNFLETEKRFLSQFFLLYWIQKIPSTAKIY